MALDLKKIGISTGFAFKQLTDANGEKLVDEDGKPVGVNLFSPASTEYKSAQRKRERAEKGKENDDDAREKARIEYLVAVTHSWVGVEFEGLSGAELSRKIYSEASLMSLHQQIESSVTRFANFLPQATSN